MDKITIITDHPIAIESNDHLYPAGALGAGTSVRFIDKIRSLRNIESVLDIGCAGAGLVYDWLDHGVLAVGIDGATAAETSESSRWSEIRERFGEYVFGADVTHPFQLRRQHINDDGSTIGDVVPPRAKFDLITCHELFEHIDEGEQPTVMANINRHARPDTLFVGSTSWDDSYSEGVNLHVSKHDRVWWADFFTQHGWYQSPIQFEHMCPDDFLCQGMYTSQFVLERRD